MKNPGSNDSGNPAVSATLTDMSVMTPGTPTGMTIPEDTEMILGDEGNCEIDHLSETDQLLETPPKHSKRTVTYIKFKVKVVISFILLY